MASTKEALFIGVLCPDLQLNHLKSQCRSRDGAVWKDDSVEIFLKAQEDAVQPYYHFLVNARGTLYDSYNKDKSWNGKTIKVGTRKIRNAWMAEIAIPFSELNLPKDKPALAQGWRFNLTRLCPGHGSKRNPEESAWSPTDTDSSHVPTRFGFAFLEVFGGKIPGE